jgi:hypothetical protein
MYRFTGFPQWIITIFSLLCLFQVKCWFEEVIESFREGANHFIFRGSRYTFLPNRAFILDESLEVYGHKSRHLLN